ncbi:MAG: helix-turn-helix domain-containing protein [Aureispira sp.]
MLKSDLHIQSVSHLHQIKKYAPPAHPLITIIDASQIAYGEQMLGLKFSSELYCISLKDKITGFGYGRNRYDFSDGVLFFTAPQQIFTVMDTQELGEMKGWMLYFHRDLIRNTSLAAKFDRYNFFSYSVNEALHLSQAEETILTSCVHLIQQEMDLGIDQHSQQVLSSNLELLLNHCNRFYERQFLSRKKLNKNIVTTVETKIKEFFNSDNLSQIGQPTVSYLANQCLLSSGYLSDLLKKETGRTTKEYIDDFLLEQAKDLLLGTDKSVKQIAFDLGYNHPHYFSRWFKKKTNQAPNNFRKN